MSYINKEQAIDLIESMIADKGVAFNPHKLAMALKDMESMEIPEAQDTDLISRQAATDARRYTFGNDKFSLEAAYRDCKSVFDGITDDDSFQEADTGLVLYYANEIIFALHEAFQGKDTNILSNDCISRQMAIDAVEKAVFKGVAKSAIESLPPVEPEPVCEDCIDRYAVLAELDPQSYEYKVVKELPSVEQKPVEQPHKCVVYRDGSLCRHPIEACSECPKHEGMRAVLAERPKGEWIDTSEGTFCSECDFKTNEYYNYCQNCGADMKGTA